MWTAHLQLWLDVRAGKNSVQSAGQCEKHEILINVLILIINACLYDPVKGNDQHISLVF